MQSQRQQKVADLMSGQLSPDRVAAEPLDDENLDLKNIKDDIIMMQFKLVRKDTMKVVNT